ncbi:ATP-binding protein [Streptomyces neyagawaensis]|uniref:ATP-binding protein n=2 Tax=Streptomyces neyagawaensis TaxID=42238 RepID=UPI00201CCBB9|nr:ATP-binding protein [Streptomyces neyagawaensis]MCL6736853.1 ATP-binding protein [Streptomyces neyagawaensis]MDE1684618.1 ATP-binding protein [Streptomyces neyagawaensis]
MGWAAPRAARIARVTVRAILTSHGRGELLDLTELLTSELVCNAYRHTKGPSSVRLVALHGGRLRVLVWDGSPYVEPSLGEVGDGPCVPSPPVSDVERGRGLFLVRQCADRRRCWPLEGGNLGRGGGKPMRFEVGGEVA